MSYNQGSNPNGSIPVAVIGDSPLIWVGLGDGGDLTVAWSGDFTTTGNSLPDLFLDEALATPDCFTVYVDPSNTFTENALVAASVPRSGDFFEVASGCGDMHIDVDALVPGHAEGRLRFDAVKVVDDGDGGNGAEVARLLATKVCPPVAPPDPCRTRFAAEVLLYNAGQSPIDPCPNFILGDTPLTMVGLGDDGDITIRFPDDYATSGDSRPDLFVDEFGNSDCYFIFIDPADLFTEAAVLQAGLSRASFDGDFFLGGMFCGDQLIDLDALFPPAFGEGELRFDRLVIVDDGNGGNGAEITRVQAKNACPPREPECDAGFVTGVDRYAPGANAISPNPANLLGGDPQTFVGLGVSGRIELSFGGNFSTSGDSVSDLDIEIVDPTECYRIQLEPADIDTLGALVKAGFLRDGNFFRVPIVFCGSQAIDIDTLVSGYQARELQFRRMKIVDEGLSPDGVEVQRTASSFVCTSFLSCTNSVVDYNPNGYVGEIDPNAALGEPDDDVVALGQGGFITLGRFGQTFSTTGDAQADVFIRELGDVDNFVVGLMPADPGTEAALVGAGFSDPDGDGCFDIGTFAGTVAIDVDALIPGQATGDLLFKGVCITDDPSGPNGVAEIDATCFMVTTPFVETLGLIGDFVWNDGDGDGVQGVNEPGIRGIRVKLVEMPANVVVDQVLTDDDGAYAFVAPAGQYRVEIDFSPMAYSLSPVRATISTLDSDFDPLTRSSDDITLNPGAVITTIDGGLVPVCIGTRASIVSVPFCGPGDPVLQMTPLVIGTFPITQVFSNLPGANGWLLFSLPPVTPYTYMGCTFTIDILNRNNLYSMGYFMTDATGSFTTVSSLPVGESFVGVQLLFQVRLCLPGGPPGPFPGFGDFFTNGIVATIGCP